MSLTGIYDVTYDGKVCGSLQVTREGVRTVFLLNAGGFDGVFRLLCACGGKYVPIGIPAPEEDGQRLKKTFTRNALAEKGLVAIEGCILLPIGEPVPPPADNAGQSENTDTPAQDDRDTVIYETVQQVPENGINRQITPKAVSEDESGHGWQPEPEPWRFFENRQLAGQCRGITGAMVSHDNGETRLALPFSLSGPFPLISAFRLGAVSRLGDREYVIFRLKNGQPV